MHPSRLEPLQLALASSDCLMRILDEWSEAL